MKDNNKKINVPKYNAFTDEYGKVQKLFYQNWLESWENGIANAVAASPDRATDHTPSSVIAFCILPATIMPAKRRKAECDGFFTTVVTAQRKNRGTVMTPTTAPDGRPCQCEVRTYRQPLKMRRK